ncbi:MAG TPA: hypothetical protein VJY62_09435 [Bacteroidia bacterium]|nr:hypothetical protein [Bacteroidia bacterium]
MFFKKLFFFCLILFCADIIKAQTPDQIITKHIEFIGGENWKKVNSIVSSGKYNYGGMEFSFTSYSKAPNLYKYVVSLKGKNYTQSFDGKNGWKMDGFNNDTTPTFLAGKDADAMANEADVELESRLIDYKKKGHKAILEGNDTIQSISCFKIKFMKSDSEAETYFFNTGSYELMMKSAVSKNEEMKNAIINTFYSDYRSVNGLKIPFKSISKVNDQTILTVTIDKVELNVSVPDSIFKP